MPHCPGDMADILLLSYLRMCCVKGKIVIAAAEKIKQIKRSLTMSNVTLPLLATCFYIKIYRVACSQQSIFHGDVFQTSEFRSAEEKKFHSRNMRAAKTISIFVAVFFSCWIPFSFISLVSNLCDTRCVQNIPQEVIVLFLMFAWLPQFSAIPFSTLATADSNPPCRRCCYHSSPSYRSIEVIEAVIEARVGTLHS